MAIDWSAYSGKILAIHCTADAIIPQWAYMLVTVYAAPYAEKIYLADPDQACINIMKRSFTTLTPHL